METTHLIPRMYDGWYIAHPEADTADWHGPFADEDQAEAGLVTLSLAALLYMDQDQIDRFKIAYVMACAPCHGTGNYHGVCPWCDGSGVDEVDGSEMNRVDMAWSI